MNLKKSQTKKRQEFSKVLLIQESVLIWIITLAALVLAFICVSNAYFGELAWITTLIALPWTAYGASQAFYYEKAKKENTKDGIKYESLMKELGVEPTNFIEEYPDEILNEDEIAAGLGIDN